MNATVVSPSLVREDPEWLDCRPTPEKPIELPARPAEDQIAIASIYNRLGGLMALLASRYQIHIPSLLAIWAADGGWRPLRRYHAPIRFRVHHFFETWGRRLRHDFDEYFRFGGHNLQAGQPWENHEYRTQKEGRFSSVHHNQQSEYEAVTLARVLAGDECSLSALNIGGLQIPISDYPHLGFGSALEMYETLQDSETIQLLTFIDYCGLKQTRKGNVLLFDLQSGDLKSFAHDFAAGIENQEHAEKLVILQRRARQLLESGKGTPKIEGRRNKIGL